MNTTWSTTTRILAIVAIVVAAVWIIVVASPLWQAVGIAALLAYLLDPAVRFLMRRTRMGRSWAAALVFLSGICSRKKSASQVNGVWCDDDL